MGSLFCLVTCPVSSWNYTILTWEVIFSIAVMKMSAEIEMPRKIHSRVMNAKKAMSPSGRRMAPPIKTDLLQLSATSFLV